MCGILFRASDFRSNPSPQPLSSSHIETIKNRGPDAQDQFLFQHEHLHVFIYASVLHLRGLEITRQPVLDQISGDVFCWNGEVFGGIQIHEECGDTSAMAQLLFAQAMAEDMTGHLVMMLGQVQGPYAFLYFHQRSRRVYFGRDPLGRRSLLISRSEKPSMITLSSAPSPDDDVVWSEVSVNTLFCLDLKDASFPVTPIARSKNPYDVQVSGPDPQLALSMGGQQLIPPLDDGCAYATTTERLRLIPAVTHPRMHAHLQSFYAALLEAIRRRIPTAPAVAVLFSGGLDSTLIAYLLHQCLPPHTRIDLINVAFENPNKPVTDYSVPDRLTARTSLLELQRMAPHRLFHLHLKNISFQTYTAHRARIIRLMHPNASVMDLSIASALWFASQATPARILFSGLGADELFGGYTRHRFDLRERLQQDLGRLAYRNCGRDDRVLADSGCEWRLPFLDERVVRVACGVPLQIKCVLDQGMPRGVGEKWFLRCLARWLGFEGVCVEAKRAIQFGARTAKMVAGERGDDRVDGQMRVE